MRYMFSIVKKKWNCLDGINSYMQTILFLGFLNQNTFARNLIKSHVGKDICFIMTEGTSYGPACDEVIENMKLLLCR